MAAQGTASYAAGDIAGMGRGLGDESRTLKGKRRRTVYSPAAKPLFAAEAEFRASKVFTRSKKGMLALYGTDLQVVDVAGLDGAAADGSGLAADVTSHVLRWVNIADLLDISFAGPATLRIEHGDTSDKPKLRGIGEPLAAASEEDLSQQDPRGQSVGGVSLAAGSMGAAAGGSSSSNASIRVTYDTFTLTFRDAGVAQRAAAALLFQQSQYSAVRHWLRQGLHAGFRCDLVSVTALPLLFDGAASNPGQHSSGHGAAAARALARGHSTLPPHVLYSLPSGSFGRVSFSGGSSGAGARSGPGNSSGAAAAAAEAAYPWGDASLQDWGCAVPLPAGWGPVLDAAMSASSGGAGGGEDGPGVTPEELTCPVVLEHGPKALQVTISTPLGAAVATITPQLAKAALLHSSCRDVLALPLRPANSSSSHSSSPAAPLAAFTWTVQGSIQSAPGAAAGVEVSKGSSGNVSGAGLSETDDGVGSCVSSAGVSGGAGGLPLSYTLDAYAAVTVQVVCTPATANKRGVGKVFNPDAPTATAAATQAASAARAGQAGSSSSSSSGRGGSRWHSNSSLQVQIAGCVLLAALALQQSSGQAWLLLLQLLLLAALAGAAVITAASTNTTSSSSSSSSTPGGAGQQTAAATDDSSSSEDVRCCAWSLLLVTADLCSAPSRHLQLQVSLAKASRGQARLRLRMASMSTGGAPVPLVGADSLQDEEDEDDSSVPVLVSSPEPLWLNTDTKQRFINAKPTLEASQEQARRTHKWRQQMDVDTVLMRPCPKFPLMARLLPTYLLSDDSPEGHAVVLMKVGGVKDLCDAIFQSPEGSPEGLSMYEAEQALALLNEYLVQIAAPKPIPAGFQVQIYDFAGFKLSYLNSDMMALFKMLVRFGLYYPERLRLALIINAPAWFSTPWKAMSVFLDENTSAKVVVVGKPQAALSTIAHHMGGIENVPVAWGGTCELAFEDYPATKRMLEFGLQLNAGQKPFPGLRAC